MFQALGVHGPELSFGWAAFLDIALVSAAFAFALRSTGQPHDGGCWPPWWSPWLRFVLSCNRFRTFSLSGGGAVGRRPPRSQARRGLCHPRHLALQLPLSRMVDLFQALGWSVVAIGAHAKLVVDGRLNHIRLHVAAALVAPMFGAITTLSSFLEK